MDSTRRVIWSGVALPDHTDTIDQVWEKLTEYDTNLVEVHVSALRRKLEAHGPRLVQTVRGVGYVLRT